MKQVYLAGAMSCYKDQEEARKWRRQVRNAFSTRSDKFVFFDPTDYYDYESHVQKSEKEIMRFELRALAKSDLVLVNLKDIDKSIGTTQELAFAYAHNIPILGFIEGATVDLHPWLAEEIDRYEEGDGALFQIVEYISYYYS